MEQEQQKRQWIKKAISGDEAAFEKLLESCHSKAYAVAFRYMKSEADTLDVLQEAYLKLFLKLSSFSFRSAFDTWLIRIVINCCYDALRKQKKQGELPLLQEGEQEAAGQDLRDRSLEPEGALLVLESRDKLSAALDELEREHRDILILREYQQYSYGEIADILAIKEGTVKSRLHRAKLALRQVLLEQDPDYFV